jgi:hypothetical protein
MRSPAEAAGPDARANGDVTGSPLDGWSIGASLRSRRDDRRADRSGRVRRSMSPRSWSGAGRRDITIRGIAVRDLVLCRGAARWTPSAPRAAASDDRTR